MFTDFYDGIRSYGKALSLIKELGLWRYAIVPAIFSVLLAIGIGFSAWGFSDNVGNFLVSWYPWDFGSDLITSISSWVGGALVALMGLILFKYLVLILSSPFMSFLSETIENELTSNQNKSVFSLSGAIKDIWRGIQVSARNFFREIAFTIIFLLLGLVPLVGFLSPFLLFFTQAYFAGFGNLDYTLERHFSVVESTRFVKKHKYLAIGNGSVFLLLLMTGVGFLIAPPLATVAGTLESFERLKTNHIDFQKQEEFV